MIRAAARRASRFLSAIVALGAVVTLGGWALPPARPLPHVASDERFEPLVAYIEKTWRPLTRTAADLPRAAEDPKVPHQPGAPWPVYVVPYLKPDIAAELARVLPARDLARVDLRPLISNDVREHGLLYLPRPYVVPGGRFNEMYGWDS
ncbi:MAG TPA: trehalase family glycosidase, partial [Polyangia bacterium]|nr:trehalase family glycosidase [Polyangia bacterium]